MVFLRKFLQKKQYMILVYLRYKSLFEHLILLYLNAKQRERFDMAIINGKYIERMYDAAVRKS